MAPKKKDEAQREILVDLESYTRTRDHVVSSLYDLLQGLDHVQNGLKQLLNSYRKHTQSVIGGDPHVIDALQIPEHLVLNASNATHQAVQDAGAALAAATQTPKDATKKRKREKKEKDPNAPKKPLTAAFLYAQQARAIVKADLENMLGENQKLEPNAVSNEINKRWAEMPEQDKEEWRKSYRSSMEKWKVDIAEYNAGLLKDGKADTIPDIHEEEEEEEEAEAGAIDSDASDDDEDAASTVPAKPSTPPAKTPRANKRQKTAATPQANGSSIAPPLIPGVYTSTPVPLPIIPSSSNVEATHTPAPVKSAAKEKKKPAGKAAPQAIAPAPAAGSKEPSPDEAKKKTAATAKSGRATRNTEAGESEGTTAMVIEKETPKVVVKKSGRNKRKSEGGA